MAAFDIKKLPTIKMRSSPILLSVKHTPVDITMVVRVSLNDLTSP